MRIFISFNSRDLKLAEAARSKLLEIIEKADIFFSPVSLGQGFWLPRLAEKISQADAMLLLVGPAGVGPWQEVEYHEAFARHVKDPKFALVPLIIGGTAPGLPFLRRLNWVVAPEGATNQVMLRVTQVIRGDVGEAPPPFWKLVHPYRGLEAMTEASADYFRGRSNETISLIEILAQKRGRLPMLIGASGVGKTSIAQAGVLSSLKAMRWPESTDDNTSKPWPIELSNTRTDWAWLTIRPGDDPVGALAGAFTKLWLNDPRDPERGPLTRKWSDGLRNKNSISDLIDATQEALEVRDGTKPERILLYVDQGEELYTRGLGTGRRFSELLSDGLADKRLSAFGSLRADYFDRLQADKHLYGIHELVSVPPLSRQALSDIVTGPAQSLGVTFEDERLASRIVDAAAEQPGALPLLSYLLTDMWSAMTKRGDGQLRLPMQAIDVGGVLSARAEEFLKANPTEEARLKRILTLKLALVPPDGEAVRRPASKTDCTAEEWSLIERLADHPWRLVVIREGDGHNDVVAEVAHEALLRAWPRLEKWLAEEREFLIFKGEMERSERRWLQNNRSSQALLTGLDLVRAREWLPQRGEDLSTEPRRFINQSIAADEAIKAQSLRFQRRVSWGFAVAAMLLLTAGSFAGWQWYLSNSRGNELQHSSAMLRTTSAAAHDAQSRYLADLAYSRIRAGDAGSGLLYALAALPEHPDGRPVVNEAERALLSAGQRLQEIAVLSGHDAPLSTAIFSPDGKSVVTASLDGSVRLWRSFDAKGSVQLIGHTAGVVKAHFSPDGSRIVTASLDGTSRVWDAGSGKSLLTLKGHSEAVWSAAYSPDGKRIATSSEDRTVRIWNADSGEQIHVLEAHYDTIWDVVFSPDGLRLASASDDNTACLWDSLSGKLIRMLGQPDATYFAPDADPPPRPLPAGVAKPDAIKDKLTGLESRLGHRDSVRTVRFSPDGKFLLTASKDWSANIWDGETGAHIKLLYEHHRELHSAQFSPTGKEIVTTSGAIEDATDNTARIWRLSADPKARISLSYPLILGRDRDARSYDRSQQSTGSRAEHEGVIWNAEFDAAGERMVTASQDGTARIWDIGSGRQISVLRGHQGQVVDAHFDQSGNRVITASKDGTARIWNAGISQEFNTFTGHTGGVLTAVFSPDSRRIVSTSEDRSAILWDAVSGRRIASLAQQETVWRARFSRDGQKVLTTSEDGNSSVWDAETGELITELGRSERQGASNEGHLDHVRDGVFSPDGSFVITVGDDANARVWDASDGRLIRVLIGHRNAIRSVEFSPDGKTIVTSSSDQTARVWSVASGDLISVFEGHNRELSSASFSPDGNLVVSTSGRDADLMDNSARLWDPRTGTEVHILRGHRGALSSAHFSPDGRFVVTASEDSTARVWEVSSGAEVGLLAGHEREVRTARFSPDGKKIVTASKDGTARLWDAHDYRQTAILVGHEDVVWSADFSPDGRRIVTASQDFSIRVWDAESGRQIVFPWRSPQDVLWARFNKESSRLITSSADGTVTVWDVRSGVRLAELPRADGPAYRSFFVNVRGESLIATVTGRENEEGYYLGAPAVRFFDAKTFAPVPSESEKSNELKSAGELLAAAAFSPTLRRMVPSIRGGSNKPNLSGIEPRWQIAELKGHSRYITAVTFSADGKRLATASRDASAIVWDANDGKQLAKLQGHLRPIRAIDFNDSGSRIVTAAGSVSVGDTVDNTARIWDASTGQVQAVLTGHEGSVETATFSADGLRVLTASKDATARVWEASTGKQILVLRGHTGPLTSARFNSDGRLVVTTSHDGTARVWDSTTGELISVYQSNHEPSVAKDAVTFPDSLGATASLDAIVSRARSMAPRCLTAEERIRALLPKAPPQWCIDLAKWPHKAEIAPKQRD